MKNKLKKLIRRLTRFAWDDFLYDVARVEWKYGRNDNGTPKQWTEWVHVRDHLREVKSLRKPEELEIP